MFQKNVQWFVDRLAERLVPTIGSFIASALQRMIILNHADHQNQLEEQALRYEAAGRLEVAKLIREQAKELTLDKPLPIAHEILSEFDAENPALFEATLSSPTLGLPDGTRKARVLRKRIDDVSSESEGELL